MTERLLIGTGNPGKQREYRELLAGLDDELVVPDDLDPVPPEPEETGKTFAENAAHKARTYAAVTGLRTVADDSGLEVDALRGAPGLRSRRFFGDDASAAERNTKLLALLEASRGSRARVRVRGPRSRVAEVGSRSSTARCAAKSRSSRAAIRGFG